MIDQVYPTNNWKRDTLHTTSLIRPCIQENDSVLAVGCGSGLVLWQLSREHRLSRTAGVDIVDCRMAPVSEFALYDGTRIPFPDGEFDVVLLTFVLHHVPNELKPALINEARRVSRRHVVVIEDTPRNFIDRTFNRLHAEKYRKSINSTASYGFYSQERWEQEFVKLGFSIDSSKRIGRFERHWKQPYARAAFILGVPAREGRSAGS